MLGSALESSIPMSRSTDVVYIYNGLGDALPDLIIDTRLMYMHLMQPKWRHIVGLCTSRTRFIPWIQCRSCLLYSISLALAAMVGSSSLLSLTEVLFHADEVSLLASKVKLSVDPTLNELYAAQPLARVKVTTGQQMFVPGFRASQGKAANPLSWKDLKTTVDKMIRFVATETE